MDVGVPGDSPEIDRKALDAYGRKLSEIAGKQASYPKKLQNLGLGGTTIVKVRIGGDSKILDVTIDTSSGHLLLDEEAIRAVRKAKPLPMLPEGLRGRGSIVTIPFHFRLE
jgi:protein TonB